MRFTTAIFSFIFFAVVTHFTGKNQTKFLKIFDNLEDTGEQCKTPTQDSGVCIPAKSCQPVLNVLQSVSKPVRPEIKAFLRSYECGTVRDSSKVCCPSKPINIEEAPPLDVSGHKNLYLLPKDCGYLDTSSRIVGGKKTGPFDFPWMALLSYQKVETSEFLCDGTIINDRYILTAAHCITNLKYPLIEVRVGEHDIRTSIDCEITDEGDEICAPPYQDLKIVETIVHPEYSLDTHFNDIGLIRVSPMNLSVENCRPVCLPLGDTRNINLVNKKVLVTGWGRDYDTERPSPELLQVTLLVLSLDECRQKYKRYNIKIDYRHLCAGQRGKDACVGDSGGPLHITGELNGDQRLIQKGLVSFGYNSRCGYGGIPGVYINLDYYMDWILDNIKP